MSSIAMRRTVLLLAAGGAALIAAPGRSQPTAAEMAENAARAAALERTMLCQAGFRPIAEAAGAGADIRRVRYNAPALAIRMPGLSLQRLADGRVRLTLSGGGKPGVWTAPIPAATWDAFAAREAAAFAPPIFPPADPKRPPGPPPICHGWSMTLEGLSEGGVRQASGGDCSYAYTKATVDYGRDMARLALDTLPQCGEARTASSDPLYALAQCKGRFEPQTLDTVC